MDTQTVNTIVTGLVGVVGPVVGWMLRHYTMPATPPVPVAQPVTPAPVVVSHPLLTAVETVIGNVLTQTMQHALTQAVGVSQVTVGVPAAPAPK